MKKLFSLICVIAYFIPICGQNDTITADGLFLKYNRPYYSSDENLIRKVFEDKDFIPPPPNDADMVRGELDRVTKRMGLTYKALPQYIISETFALDGSTNPFELRTTSNIIASQWIHEDGECILFFKGHGMTSRIDRSIDELPETTLNWIKHTLNMGSFLDKTTDEQMKKIKNIITIWSPEKSREVFNAQYVITYPIKDKKSVYMGKYAHKLELIMIKWGENLSVSFLVTKKGNKNIKKYIKDVESTFRFDD